MQDTRGLLARVPVRETSFSLPPEVVEFVQLRNLKTGVEAVNLFQDHLENRQYWRDRRQHQNQSWSSRPFNRGGATASGFREEGRKQDPASREPVTKREYLKYVYIGMLVVEVAIPQPQTGGRMALGFPLVLHVKRGHKPPECPNKVGRIITPGKHEPFSIEGKIGKQSCSMTINTGAQLIVVKAGLVESED